MATAITEDFVTKNGIVVQGTSAVTSSTGQSNALQVNGGAGIAKNIIVGTTATIGGDTGIGGSLNVGTTLTVGSNSYLDGKVTATGIVSITDSTAATTSSIGALVVSGGIYASGNLIVSNTSGSTSTLVDNSLYVAGGVGIAKSLFVHGPAVFENDVVFNGETTYVYSTNTVYTDNLIELHTPVGEPEWTVDDGKDIGLRFHYFDSTSSNAALVLANDSKFLEWYGAGAESITGTFSDATYGTFKTGNILLAGTGTASSTITGALQVVGGIGVGGEIYSGGSLNASSITDRELTQGRIVLVGPSGKLTDFSGLTYSTETNVLSASVGLATTASNIAGGAVGSIVYQTNSGVTDFIPIGPAGFVLLSTDGIPTWTTFGGITAGAATTASNFSGGADTEVPFQNGPGSTAFSANFRFDYSANTFRTVSAVFTGTVNASNTISGTVQVVGGVGIGQDLYIGGNETIVGDLAVNGGDLTTNAATFNLINTTATAVNFAGEATAITIGSSSGYTEIKNQTTITSTVATSSIDTGALQVRGGVGVTGSMFVGDTVTATNLVLKGAYATSYMGNYGSLFIDGISGNQLVQASTNNLANGIGLWTSGVANSFVYSSGGIEFTTGKTLRLNNTPTGGVTRMAIGATGNVSMTAGTSSTGITTGTLVVTGGVGISGDIYIGGQTVVSGSILPSSGSIELGTLAAPFAKLYLSGNALYIDNTVLSSTGSTLTISSLAGSAVVNTGALILTTTTNASNTVSGALQVAGGAGIGGDVYIGGNEIVLGDLEVRGGDITTNQSIFNLLNDTASTINFAGAGTAITIGTTTGFTEIKNATTLTNATVALSTNSGALQVRGGTGIGGNLYVGGVTVLNALTATVTTSTTLTVSGTAAVAGVLSVTEGSNANAINNGAVRVTGGVGISRDVVVGGQITAGVTEASTTGTSVSGFYSNNTLLASFTSNLITGTGQVNLDTFSSVVYRSARYFIQIVDGSSVQISEISLFHDGVKAYLSEYGISTNNGQLGSFDATWDSSNVTVKFTPVNATAMTIKMTRTTITS